MTSACAGSWAGSVGLAPFSCHSSLVADRAFWRRSPFGSSQEVVELLDDKDRHDEPDRLAGQGEGEGEGVPAERQERLALHEHGGVQHHRMTRTGSQLLLRLQFFLRLAEPLVPDGVLAVEHAVEPAQGHLRREGEPVIGGLQFAQDLLTGIEQRFQVRAGLAFAPVQERVLSRLAVME